MKKLAAVILNIIAVVALLNMPVTTRQGVDYKVSITSIPLYIKTLDFIDRHCNYRLIADRITRGAKDGDEVVLKILGWTKQNVRPVPYGMPIIDDHILNIIIRGYGTPDQSQDVFTTLCAYKGMTAFWKEVYAKGTDVSYPLSFVKIKNRWRVFDAYYGKYFKTKSGEIADVQEIMRIPSILDDAGIGAMSYKGVPYADFYKNLGSLSFEETTRAAQQMPFKRLILEFKKLINL